jgi:hypothetical protein
MKSKFEKTVHFRKCKNKLKFNIVLMGFRLEPVKKYVKGGKNLKSMNAKSTFHFRCIYVA